MNVAAARPVSESLQEYARGVAGGLLFSLPLLYTMEVWWAGFNTHPWRLLGYAGAGFLLLLGYNRYGGLRRNDDWRDVVIEVIDVMGLGLLLTALLLWLLDRINLRMPLGEIAGKIVVEAMIAAIGISIGEAQLGGDESEGDRSEEQGENKSGKEEGRKGSKEENGKGKEESHRKSLGSQLVFAVCGAVLFSASVAATDEIVIIAVESSWWKLLALALISLTLAVTILFFSNFRGAQKLAPTDGLSAVLSGAVITYAVALVTTAVVLWFFGRFEGLAVATCLAETVVLGVAATLGAAAGELLLQ